jgi:hypothetical protein
VIAVNVGPLENIKRAEPLKRPKSVQDQSENATPCATLTFRNPPSQVKHPQLFYCAHLYTLDLKDNGRSHVGDIL